MRNNSIPAFSPIELERYSRHFNLPHVGLIGQQKLKNARVLCVGAGGLGSALLLYLAAAGVGTLGIIDADQVELSNLQRQILYKEKEQNTKKIFAAKKHLTQLNPHIHIALHDARLTFENASEIIQAYDIIADGSDNFATRYLVNDVCVQLKKPNVYASVFQFTGQCSIFAMEQGPCYRCLYESSPTHVPNCAEGGVLGTLPGLMGTLQATEVIKLILGIGDPLIGKVLTIDALTLKFQTFTLNRNPLCRLCAQHQPLDPQTYHDLTRCSITPSHAEEISVNELHALYHQKIPFTLLDVRTPEEHAVSNLGGQLIPLAQLSHRLHELDKNKLTIVHCHAGIRGQEAANLLRAAGFSSVKNLTGGILAWFDKKDL